MKRGKHSSGERDRTPPSQAFCTLTTPCFAHTASTRLVKTCAKMNDMAAEWRNYTLSTACGHQIAGLKQFVVGAPRGLITNTLYYSEIP